jgi:hypothetical protein
MRQIRIDGAPVDVSQSTLTKNDILRLVRKGGNDYTVTVKESGQPSRDLEDDESVTVSDGLIVTIRQGSDNDDDDTNEEQSKNSGHQS